MWKSYVLQTPEFPYEEMLGNDEYEILSNAKSLYPSSAYMVRGNGITGLVEIDGQIIQKGQLKETQLKAVFTELTDKQVAKILSEYV